jgi:hypothetical protein
MEMESLFSPKAEFQNLWNEAGRNREGVDALLAWLETTDFYTAPCSTKYHLSREGGLLEHSINVFKALQQECINMGIEFPLDSLIICGLGHDFCKTNFYGQEMRNVKKTDEKTNKEYWTKEPYYTVKDQLPYGHGEKSALLVNKYIKLTISEFMAIRWHMGGFTPGIQDHSLSQALSGAFKEYPLALLLHIADMKSSYLLEKEGSA